MNVLLQRSQPLRGASQPRGRVLVVVFGAAPSAGSGTGASTAGSDSASATLTCNPAYRYGMNVPEDERETRLRADTMAEFLHYAMGCMFGRYSLDAPGLILAHQGEGLADYLARIPEPSFLPDANNVIPMLDADWRGGSVSRYSVLVPMSGSLAG